MKDVARDSSTKRGDATTIAVVPSEKRPATTFGPIADRATLALSVIEHEFGGKG
jgi:hypothetical protein